MHYLKKYLQQPFFHGTPCFWGWNRCRKIHFLFLTTHHCHNVILFSKLQICDSWNWGWWERARAGIYLPKKISSEFCSHHILFYKIKCGVSYKVSMKISNPFMDWRLPCLILFHCAPRKRELEDKSWTQSIFRKLKFWNNYNDRDLSNMYTTNLQSTSWDGAVRE